MLSSNLSRDSSQSISTNQRPFLQKQFSKIIDKHPQLTPEQSFHFQYCKLYLQNIRLNNQVNKIKLEIPLLRNSCQLSPKLYSQQFSQGCSHKKKRIRRTANQIARHYVCPIEKCLKTYGSQGSLNQHFRIKHKNILKSEFL